MDHEKHKKYIGVDNTLILDNVTRLSQAGARIYIRIPTIKEVNGDSESIGAIITFLKKMEFILHRSIFFRIIIQVQESMVSLESTMKARIFTRHQKKK